MGPSSQYCHGAAVQAEHADAQAIDPSRVPAVLREIFIAKQRNGPTGNVLTRFTASRTRFDSLTAGDYPEGDEDGGGA
jgi:hypothetical protein